MTRSSAAALFFGRLCVVFSAAAAMACHSVGVQGAPSANNPLPNGVDPDPAAFRQSIAAFKPGLGHTRARDAKCFLGLCKDVQVRIEAVGNTLSIDPDNAPGAGVPVARLVNFDAKKTEAYYGLKPGTESEYYLWVDSIPRTRKARWTLLEVPLQGGRVLAAKPTELRLCHRRGPNDPKASEADFAENKYDSECTARVATAVSTAHTASILSFRPLIALIDNVIAIALAASSTQGGWIDCSNGCCT